MTALPPEERPPGRPELPADPSSAPTGSARAWSGRQPTRCPSDETFELLANVVAFQAVFEDHDRRRPGRGHPLQARRWRREHEVLLLQRQVLRLRVDALPVEAYRPFPRPVV